MIDGLRPEPLVDNRYKNLAALRARSSWTLQASSVMPTKTMSCHMTIFHSVPPSRHGVTSNTWVPMEDPLPGLIDVAREAGLRCGFFYNWEKLRNLSQPSSLDFSFFKDNVFTDPDGERILVKEALRYITRDNPDFLFSYFGTLDTAGENFGWLSPEYYTQLEQVDGTLGKLLDNLPTEGSVLLQSDHGGHDRRHGTDLPEDMTIPWMVAGPGIRRGYEIRSTVTLLETAPTLARILGIEPHPEWEGHCVEEIFE